MAFPDYKRRLFWKVPDGWEDLGEQQEHLSFKEGVTMRSTTIHKFCHSTLHIGRDDQDSLFMFCARCLVKIPPNLLNHD